MKKTLSLLLALVLCISLCACGSVNLSAEQKAVCEETDGFFAEMLADSVPGSTVTSTVKVVDGKLIYYCTLDIKGTFSAIESFQALVMPVLESSFSENDMYVVLEIKEFGESEWRLIDSKLDPDILD